MKTYKEVIMEESSNNDVKMFKSVMLKLKRASDTNKKTKIWYDADLSKSQSEEIVRLMVLSLPGSYKLHGREYGTNLVDTVYKIYGSMPSMFVSQSMLLGLQVLHPKKVYASFTHGLDAIEIKK